MKTIKIICISLVFLSSFAHAEETMWEKMKSGASSLWEKTKSTSSEVAEDVSDKASELSDEIPDETKEAGKAALDTMKEFGTSAAEGARNGAAKIKEMVDENCKEDNVLCFKDKE